MGNPFQKAQQEFGVILGCCSTVYPQMLTTTAVITNNNHNHYVFNWAPAGAQCDSEPVVGQCPHFKIWGAPMRFYRQPVWDYIV